MKLSMLTLFSAIFLSISLVFLIITFTIENWILVKTTLDRYGMWRACRGLTFNCSNWYDSGELLMNYSLSSSFKAFQGLQATMVGLTFITLCSFLINLKTCGKMYLIFIIDALLIMISFLCGLISLIIFGVAVYKPELHQLDWCYWLSVAACCLQLFSFIFIFVFSIRMIDLSDNNSTKVKLNPRNDFNQQKPSLNNPLPRTNFKAQPIQQYQPSNECKTVSTYKKRSFKRNNLKKSKYRYNHHHFTDYMDTIEREHFQSGYTSEPDNIEYSIDRSWRYNYKNLNKSLPENLNNQYLSNTIQSRHFVKLPKLIYYDGVDHYSRPYLSH